MNPTEHIQLMGVTLQHEVEVVSRLMELLLQEREALAAHDAGALEKAAQDKQQQLSKVESWEQERNHLLTSGGYPATQHGMEQYLKAQNNPRLDRLWQQLLSLSGKCHHQNQVNGGIVEAGRHHIQRALAILRGVSPDAELYGPAGKTRSLHLPNTLTTA
ncbi:MAG: flagellar protein FlgN [Gammaproteobacteria bacterium]|nr:flagellar protein FlgN [Gammaproteobacteria bacterium]